MCIIRFIVRLLALRLPGTHTWQTPCHGHPIPRLKTPRR